MGLFARARALQAAGPGPARRIGTEASVRWHGWLALAEITSFLRGVGAPLDLHRGLLAASTTPDERDIAATRRAYFAPPSPQYAKTPFASRAIVKASNSCVARREASATIQHEFAGREYQSRGAGAAVQQ